MIVFACQQRMTTCLSQVVTVLANMSAVSACIGDITACHGVELLVELLHEKPPDAATDAELTACEHVQQKAAIALSRLCRDVSSAALVVSVGGVPRLVQLCRVASERNNSDAVLVSCLVSDVRCVW